MGTQKFSLEFRLIPPYPALIMLTLHEYMWKADGLSPSLGRDAIAYEVLGFSNGHRAWIAEMNHKWQILEAFDGVYGTWQGGYASERDALAILSLEERADELAQHVMNAWGTNVSAGNAAYLTAEFKELFEKVCRYRTAKDTADNRREFKNLSEQEATDERNTRRVFVEAFKELEDRMRKAA
jgi:hypothetical protein